MESDLKALRRCFLKHYKDYIDEFGHNSQKLSEVLLQKTHAILSVLKGQEESGAVTALPVADSSPVDWRKSIRKHAITCLECGQAFKQLSIRHLGIHGLDGLSYRMKYAIPTTQPLSARSTTDRRRQVVRQTRRWKKSPTYIKGQGRDGHRTPEPEETDAPIAEAPVQPKRQRKASTKKIARKTRSEG